MAVTHIHLGQTSAAARLRGCVLGLQSSRDALSQEVATLQTMITGDSSTADQFDLVVTEYGIVGTPQITANALAQALWNELNSVLSKVSTDGTVDHVNAAINQATNKIR